MCLVSLKSVSLIGMVRRPRDRPFSGEVTWQSANWQSVAMLLPKTELFALVQLCNYLSDLYT